MNKNISIIIKNYPCSSVDGKINYRKKLAL
jgi:hypothetical protein